jgi:hypothetical protein
MAIIKGTELVSMRMKKGAHKREPDLVIIDTWRQNLQTAQSSSVLSRRKTITLPYVTCSSNCLIAAYLKIPVRFVKLEGHKYGSEWHV